MSAKASDLLRSITSHSCTPHPPFSDTLTQQSSHGASRRIKAERCCLSTVLVQKKCIGSFRCSHRAPQSNRPRQRSLCARLPASSDPGRSFVFRLRCTWPQLLSLELEITPTFQTNPGISVPAGLTNRRGGGLFQHRRSVWLAGPEGDILGFWPLKNLHFPQVL